MQPAGCWFELQLCPSQSLFPWTGHLTCLHLSTDLVVREPSGAYCMVTLLLSVATREAVVQCSLQCVRSTLEPSARKKNPMYAQVIYQQKCVEK